MLTFGTATSYSLSGRPNLADARHVAPTAYETVPWSKARSGVVAGAEVNCSRARSGVVAYETVMSLARSGCCWGGGQVEPSQIWRGYLRNSHVERSQIWRGCWGEVFSYSRARSGVVASETVTWSLARSGFWLLPLRGRPIWCSVDELVSSLLGLNRPPIYIFEC